MDCNNRKQIYVAGAALDFIWGRDYSGKIL